MRAKGQFICVNYVLINVIIADRFIEKIYYYIILLKNIKPIWIGLKRFKDLVIHILPLTFSKLLFISDKDDHGWWRGIYVFSNGMDVHVTGIYDKIDFGVYKSIV